MSDDELRQAFKLVCLNQALHTDIIARIFVLLSRDVILTETLLHAIPEILDQELSLDQARSRISDILQARERAHAGVLQEFSELLDQHRKATS